MKRKMIELLLAAMVISSSLTGCAGKTEPAAAETSSVSEEKTDEKEEKKIEEKTELQETAAEASEEQKKLIEEALPNLKERLVVEKAKDVDLAASLKDEGGLVKEIEVLSTDLEPEKVGTYEVTYKVTVYEEKLKELKGQTSEKKEQETSASDTEKQTVVLLVKESVSVITEEEAEKLTEDGKEVLTDEGDIYKPEKKPDTAEKKEDSKKKETVKKAEEKKTEEKTGTGSSAAEKSPVSDKSSSGSESKVTPTPSSSGQSSSGGQAAETPVPTKEPQKTETHTHSWVPQTKTVHHDAVTQMVYVVDQESWDEDIYVEQPVYTTYSAVQCACGTEFATYAEWCSHEEYYDDIVGDYSHGSYSVVYHDEQTGTEKVYSHTVHHNETGHFENQVVKAAYDEEVSDGYQCSGCGARK